MAIIDRAERLLLNGSEIRSFLKIEALQELNAFEGLIRCALHSGRALTVVALGCFGLYQGASASTAPSPWVEMVRACEAVIFDQSFDPLDVYDPAPFSKGLPGAKEYSVYHPSRQLIAIARSVEGQWVHCLVRETEEAQTRWRELARKWVEGFEAHFPKPKYSWGSGAWVPTRPFKFAIRCLENGRAIVIAPNLDTHLYFRVDTFISEGDRKTDLCGADDTSSTQAVPPLEQVLPGPIWRKPDASRWSN